MSEMLNYKCPACGGALEFDSGEQKLKCPYCDSVFEVSEFAGAPAESPEAPKAEWNAYGSGEWAEGETDNMRVYVCDSCGGEVVADDTTGATSCPYCGSRLVMKGQFAGDLKPDFVIPFKVDKKQAKAAYFAHLKGKPFLPKVFKEENHIDEMKGLYVPFWLYTADADAHMTFSALKTRVWESGDTRYTETEKYLVRRGGTVGFENVPYDCSSKIDNTLTEAVEPYDFSEAVPFQPGYLAGFVADRYDVNKEESETRMGERIKASAEASFLGTVNGGYSSITTIQNDLHLHPGDYKYVLYPLWVLNTTWQGKKYLFAINGQTGKAVGDLPCDKAAYRRYLTLFGLGASAAAYLVIWLIQNFM